ADKIEKYLAAFLTDTHNKSAINIRKRLVTKKVVDKYPHIEKVLKNEATRLADKLNLIRAATIAECSEALIYLASKLSDSYSRQKTNRALIDFDDLILISAALLNNKQISSWVFYKLDEGFDHLLIDEAQDTSPDQWKVINGLVDEFLAGEGAKRDGRKVFVVGDVKQSIYSFQGADPKEFSKMRSMFSKRVPEAGNSWGEISLSVSFRSTGAILDMVDAVFGKASVADGVALDGLAVKHYSSRRNDSGIVELWPPIKTRDADTLTPWKPPVERSESHSPPARLAKLIAKRINHMLVSKEVLESKGRPICPGDIMILVRRRGIIVEELVKSLKALNIAVAGVDRMVLTEQISVMDLIALGRFILLPQDDLTLATVLKGPLIGLSEEDLFKLTYKRKSTLWFSLTSKHLESSKLKEAYEYLSELLSIVDYLTPFQIFSEILDVKGGRKKLLARLGPDAADPISEFLNLALDFDRNQLPSLEAFLHWLEIGRVEVKRDLENGEDNRIRIMTVHGAKGLQAPIVFLPDTMQKPTSLPPLYWLQDQKGVDEGVIWPPRRGLYDKRAEEERERVILEQDNEYRRLLYVAMTRAEDRLYISGWCTKNKASDGCWYKIIEEAIAGLGEKKEDSLLSKLGSQPGSEIIRFASSQKVSVESKVPQSKEEKIQLGSWAVTPAAHERIEAGPLIPSQINSNDLSKLSFSKNSDDNLFKRGRIIHHLFQTLPEVEPSLRLKAGEKFLALPKHRLDKVPRRKILEEVLNVLENPKYRVIFGPSSRAEVPVAGKVNGRLISAQIDRIVFDDRRIVIIDYKTNTKHPTLVKDVPVNYLQQMSIYRSLLASMFPMHKIECVIIWTSGPHLMKIGTKLLDSFEP
ncbi:MAG: double-strand break repair helicase AddA, partial [Pseudomonadota bacterium]|nr:double-strand break repair helicase AddA [Pseudomonadota bacterium]